MNGCNVIIIGGEGDLAFRKLYPALCSLDNEGLLADDVRVVCFGRGKYDHDTFRREVLRWIEASDYTEVMSDEVTERFLARLIQFTGDATDPGCFQELVELLRGADLNPEVLVTEYSPGWGGWRGQHDDILEALFPHNGE